MLTVALQKEFREGTMCKGFVSTLTGPVLQWHINLPTDISHLCISKPELINVLRQMGQQVKWSEKMKAPDSFRNPNRWSEFHNDQGQKTEDCVALRIEVNELLKKGHLRESSLRFICENTSHLSYLLLI